MRISLDCTGRSLDSRAMAVSLAVAEGSSNNLGAVGSMENWLSSDEIIETSLVKCRDACLSSQADRLMCCVIIVRLSWTKASLVAESRVEND